MARQAANLGHDFYQSLDVLKNGALQLRRGRGDRWKTVFSESGGSVAGWEGRRRAFRDGATNEDGYQALDNLQQFLHHNGDALVAEQTADGLEVRRADEVPVGAVYVGVGDVEGLQRERGRVKHKQEGFLFPALKIAISRKDARSLPWTRKGSKAARWPACLAEALG